MSVMEAEANHRARRVRMREVQEALGPVPTSQWLADRRTTLADAARFYGVPVDGLSLTQRAFADEWWEAR